MPRRRAAPRLYLDPARRQWVIRDGSSFVRTGCAESDRRGAETRLAAYLGQKHRPQRGPEPLIADILLAYGSEHLPHTRAAKNAGYNVGNLSTWWGDKNLSDVTARNCRAYAETKPPAAARRDLETLRAAIGYWHREYGPLQSIPAVVMPPKSEPRDRWLTRDEAARLLWAARRTEHLKRFILLGLYTGTRSGALLAMKWEWIDVKRGIMQRKDSSEHDSKKRRPPVRLGVRILSHLRRWQLQDYGRGRETRVIHYDGQGIRKLRRSWANAASRAGLTGITPHVLRHTRATWLMQAGIDPWEAAGHLGMSVEMLQRVYGKHSPDFQRRAAEV